VSCRPDALVIFSGILDVSKKGAGLEKFADAKAAKAASPVHLRLPKDMPPAILFHSAGDRRVPIEGARKFAAQMRRKRRPCRLVEFDGVDHSFFNFNVDSRLFDATLNAADAFLCEQGFLEGASRPEMVPMQSGLGDGGVEGEHRTSNVERRTSKIEHRRSDVEFSTPILVWERRDFPTESEPPDT
jgi:hypothetical protein